MLNLTNTELQWNVAVLYNATKASAQADCQTIHAVLRGWQIGDSELSDLQEHEASGEGGQATIMASAALKVGAQSTQQHEEGGHQHAVVRKPRRRHIAVGTPVLAHQVLHQLCQPVRHVLPTPCIACTTLLLMLVLRLSKSSNSTAWRAQAALCDDDDSGCTRALRN